MAHCSVQFALHVQFSGVNILCYMVDSMLSLVVTAYLVCSLYLPLQQNLEVHKILSKFY